MFHATFLDKINNILKKANYVISCLFVIILFCVLMLHLSKEIRDLDLWLHLKTGQQILLNKSVALVDNYSFSQQQKSWINHEWLFQLLAYIIHSNFGFDGLIVMQNIIFLVIFFIIFIAAGRRKNFLFIATMLFIFLLNISYRFTIRPDMFSALFLVLFIFILREKNRYLHILPLLQIIWTNLHGFFFLGPLTIFIFAITERKKKLWPIFLFSLIATIVNPQLIKGSIYPLTTFFTLTKDKFVFDFVQELRPPFTLKTLLNLSEWPFYKALIFISFFSFRFNQKKFSFTLFLLWLVFLVFSLFAIRNIIYFAIAAIFAIFYNANERFSYDSNFSNEKFAKNKYYYIGRYSLILAISFSMVKNASLITDCRYFDFKNYNFKSSLWGVSLTNFPKKAVDFIIKEDLPPRMYNDFNSGSYLIGRAFPLRKVFIDGRTEFYGNQFLKEYKRVSEGKKEAIEQLIKKYDLEGFLLTMAMSNFDGKLARYLFEAPEWKPVYFDDSAIIFLKDIPINNNLISKYYIDFQSWKAPKADLVKIGPTIIYPYQYIKRGIALEEMSCFTAAIGEAQEALQIAPNTANAFQILGNCYFELKDYALALKNYRLAVAFAPNAFERRNKFALTLYRLGYIQEAEYQLSRLLKFTPKDPVINYALSLIYKQQGRLKEAKEMIHKANQYSKNSDIKYLTLWAEIIFELKNYPEALVVYKLALELDPNNSEVKNNIEKIEKVL